MNKKTMCFLLAFSTMAHAALHPKMGIPYALDSEGRGTVKIGHFGHPETDFKSSHQGL